MSSRHFILCAAVLLAGCGHSKGQTPPRAATAPPLAVLPTSAPRPAVAALATSAPSSDAPPIVDPDERAIVELKRAVELYQTFLIKAGDEPRFAEGVRRSKARLEDIRSTLPFLEEGLRERNRR